MNKATPDRSGVLPRVAGDLEPETIAKCCHAILDACSALILSVEHLATESAVDRTGAVEDARASVDVVAKIARDLQVTARSAIAKKTG